MRHDTLRYWARRRCGGGRNLRGYSGFHLRIGRGRSRKRSPYCSLTLTLPSPGGGFAQNRKSRAISIGFGALNLNKLASKPTSWAKLPEGEGGIGGGGRVEESEALCAWSWKSISRSLGRGTSAVIMAWRTRSSRRGSGVRVTTRARPCPDPLRREPAYFIGEKAAGIRILFCWLTKNSRVLGGQFGNFCDSARTFARSARSL